MLLKLLQGLVTDRVSYAPGEIVEWDDSEDAKRLIEAGFAESATESATEKPKGERAATRTRNER